MAESKDALTGTGRHPTSAEIRSEIERTRSEMDQTFDALERKMTPGQILEEVWYLTRGGTRAGASKLWQVAREHPLPATVIGLGIGWLLVESSRGDGSPSRTRLGRNTRYGRSDLYESSAGYGAYPESYNTDYLDSADEAGLSDRVSSAAGAVKDAADHAKDSVKGAAASAGHKVADVAGSVREHASDLGQRTLEKASELSERTREKASELGGLTREKASELGYRTRTQARRAQTGFWQMMEENPMAVGIATLALGVLAGLSLPSTRKEDELLGEKRDRVVDRLGEVGREALETGKQVAGTAVDTLKDEAENAGLTPSGIAEKVREAGRNTKDAVKEELKNQDLTAPLVSGSQGSTSSSTGTATGAGLTGSRGRTTPRETITPVEQPELTNKR